MQIKAYELAREKNRWIAKYKNKQKKRNETKAICSWERVFLHESIRVMWVYLCFEFNCKVQTFDIIDDWHMASSPFHIVFGQIVGNTLNGSFAIEYGLLFVWCVLSLLFRWLLRIKWIHHRRHTNIGHIEIDICLFAWRLAICGGILNRCGHMCRWNISIISIWWDVRHNRCDWCAIEIINFWTPLNWIFIVVKCGCRWIG